MNFHKYRACLWGMLILFNQITLNSPLNEKEIEELSRQLEHLEIQELNLAANFTYWSYILSKHDVNVRKTHTQLYPIFNVLRQCTCDYSADHTNTLKNYQQNLSFYFLDILKRNKSYQSWQNIVQLCEQAHKRSLTEFLEEIQNLGQQLTQEEISRNPAIFDQIRKDGSDLQAAGQQLLLVGRTFNALGNKALPTIDVQKNTINLVALNSANRLIPELEKQSATISNAIEIFEHQKIKFLEKTRDFFYELYLLIYTAVDKKNGDQKLFKLITESNSIEHNTPTILPSPEDLLKN